MYNVWTRSLVMHLSIVAGLTLLMGSANAVGPPKSSDRKPFENAVSQGNRLAVIVPVFDPNLPSDPDDYIPNGVWPALRQAEADLFAIYMRDALAKIGTFDTVRVTPNKYMIGELYVLGRILHSDSEVVKLSIDLTDISGKRWLRSKTFTYRVREYDLTNPIKQGVNPYEPVFDSIANAIRDRLRRMTSKDKLKLHGTASMVMGRSYDEATFSRYLRGRRSRARLKRMPDPLDGHYQRILEIRAAEEVFVGDLQQYYDAFNGNLAEAYSEWHRLSFPEAKAYRELREEAAAATNSARRKAAAAENAEDEAIDDMFAYAVGDAGTSSDTASSGGAATGVLTVDQAFAAIERGYRGFSKRSEAKKLIKKFTERDQVIEEEPGSISLDLSGERELTQRDIRIARTLARLEVYGAAISAQSAAKARTARANGVTAMAKRVRILNRQTAVAEESVRNARVAEARIIATGLEYKTFRNGEESREFAEKITANAQGTNVELAATKVAFDGREQLLNGTPADRYLQLRDFLQTIYNQERTPDRQL